VVLAQRGKPPPGQLWRPAKEAGGEFQIFKRKEEEKEHILTVNIRKKILVV